MTARSIASAHLIGGVGVQTRGWLIQEKHTWLGHQGDANVDTLALTTCVRRISVTNGDESRYAAKQRRRAESKRMPITSHCDLARASILLQYLNLVHVMRPGLRLPEQRAGKCCVEKLNLKQ